MRLFFPIGHFYPSNVGGPSYSMYWIAKSLSTSGFAVTVVTSNHGILDTSVWNKWNNSTYGNVIYVKQKNLHLPYNLIFKSFKQVKNADLIHLNSVFHLLSFFSALFCLFFKKPFIWSVRGELENAALTYNEKTKQAYLFLVKHLFRKVAFFHATSESEYNRIKEVFGEDVKVKIIPNFIASQPIVKLKKEKYFLYIGRIHPIKNLEIILKSIYLSKSFSLQNFKLYIAGTGDVAYTNSLKKMCSELKLENAVVWLGEIKDELEKSKLYAQALGTILISKSENFGNVVVESLVHATPVITSKGTPWKILTDKKAGFWIEPDEKKLSKCLDEMIMMPIAEYQQYSDNAELLAAKFNMQDGIKIWKAFYSQIVQSK